jgi:hypothetical protein
MAALLEVSGAAASAPNRRGVRDISSISRGSGSFFARPSDGANRIND